MRSGTELGQFLRIFPPTFPFLYISGSKGTVLLKCSPTAAYPVFCMLPISGPYYGPISLLRKPRA